MNLSESSKVSQTLLTLAAFMIVVAGLKAAAPIVVPMLMAIFLAIISIAPLQWLQRHGLPLWLSMTLIFAILITTLVIVGSTLGAS
ncbi:MAG: AI-2E family transporter, partial [Proteobacteria bacterium]|nr:AI-2E family transporter [Pseudomonadota bacterium]